MAMMWWGWGYNVWESRMVRFSDLKSTPQTTSESSVGAEVMLWPSLWFWHWAQKRKAINTFLQNEWMSEWWMQLHLCSWICVWWVLGHGAHTCRTDGDSVFEVLSIKGRDHIFSFFDALYSIGAALIPCLTHLSFLMPLTWLQRPAQLFCRISHILDLLLPRCVPLSPLFPTMEISFRNFQTQLFGEQEYLISSTVTFIWIILEGTWLPGCPALNNTKIDKQVQLGSTGSHVLGLAWWSSG